MFLNRISPHIVNSILELTQAAAFPIFAVVDPWLRFGVAGGYLSTFDNHALAASQAASSLIYQSEMLRSELRVSGNYTFDYDEVSDRN